MVQKGEITMTDKEIIKALECCKDLKCSECPKKENLFVTDCDVKLCDEVLELIKRQQAKIESHESRIFALNDTNKILMETQKVYTNNVLKEFAERLKEKSWQGEIDIDIADIDNLVKELTEGSKWKEKVITREELNEILRKHKLWLENEEEGEKANLSGANLWGANFRLANLSEANLSRANLSEADLDFSCLPLWCGSLNANFDDRQLKQIAYHLVKAGLQSNNASDETKAELKKLIDFANGFHRVNECGKIEVKDNE